MRVMTMPMFSIAVVATWIACAACIGWELGEKWARDHAPYPPLCEDIEIQGYSTAPGRAIVYRVK